MTVSSPCTSARARRQLLSAGSMCMLCDDNGRSDLAVLTTPCTTLTVAKACLPSKDFDPYDPAQVSALPASVTTCTDECKAKMQAWTDPADGWGCCAPSLLNGFQVFEDLKKFSGKRPGRLLSWTPPSRLNAVPLSRFPNTTCAPIFCLGHHHIPFECCAPLSLS